MIKFSVREIAQYLGSDEATRRQLLRERKYLASEAIVRARFYSEARMSIAAYHRGALSRDAIEGRIIAMRQDARHSNPFSRAELLNNATVLERYLYYQGHRVLALAPPLAADLVRSDVKITVRPSLFAIEGEDRRLIFLELREKSTPSMMRILAEVAFEVFRAVLRNLPPQAVQVIDVRRGIIYELQQSGSAIGRDLADACKTISVLWPQLTPLKGSRQVSSPPERQMSIPWDFET
jgi:hypothetical protein